MTAAFRYGWPWPWHSSLSAALAERAGPASDYLSPPQVSRARVEMADHLRNQLTDNAVMICRWPDRRKPERLADYCRERGCPCTDQCAGQSCYLLQQ